MRVGESTSAESTLAREREITASATTTPASRSNRVPPPQPPPPPPPPVEEWIAFAFLSTLMDCGREWVTDGTAERERERERESGRGRAWARPRDATLPPSPVARRGRGPKEVIAVARQPLGTGLGRIRGLGRNVNCNTASAPEHDICASTLQLIHRAFLKISSNEGPPSFAGLLPFLSSLSPEQDWQPGQRRSERTNA